VFQLVEIETVRSRKERVYQLSLGGVVIIKIELNASKEAAK
jgi:hypothetical protein